MTSNTKQIVKIILLLIFFAIIWQIYNYLYRKNNNQFLDMEIVDVPHSVKCFFNESKCEEGNINGWTLIYGLMYFIIGLVVPNQYLAILIISILFELFQSYHGNNAKYIIGPLVSLTGYGLGSLFNIKKYNYKKKYQVLVD